MIHGKKIVQYFLHSQLNFYDIEFLFAKVSKLLNKTFGS